MDVEAVVRGAWLTVLQAERCGEEMAQLISTTTTRPTTTTSESR